MPPLDPVARGASGFSGVPVPDVKSRLGALCAATELVEIFVGSELRTSLPSLNTVQTLVVLENHMTNTVTPDECALTPDFPLLPVFRRQCGSLQFFSCLD